MKIFYKRDYNRVLDELGELKNKNELTQKELKEIKCKFKCALKEISEQNEKLTYFEMVEKDRNALIEKVKSLNASHGGFTKQINKLKAELEELKKQNEDLENKLKESMTDKYLVKKIQADKHKDTFGMKIRQKFNRN